MQNYHLIAVGIGAVVIIAAWVPITLERRPLSLPIVLVALGALLFSVPGLRGLDPRDHIDATIHLTEAGVLVALLGAGISIDRPLGRRRWSSTWRLVTVGMIASIAGISLVGHFVMGLPFAAALLLGAVLAPTDPVLASDVQVGEPELDGRRLDCEDEVRFALTSEAGLNDGMAFPFVYAALAASATTGSGWVSEWLMTDVLLRVLIGGLIGWVVGTCLGRLMFDPPWGLPAIAESSKGFVALGTIVATYGLAELAHGYGFLAVFAAALAVRGSSRTHEYHVVLHDFTVQIENLISSVLLVLFGGALVSGLLSDLTWGGVAVGVGAIVVVRPVAGWLAMLGSGVAAPERRAIAFFGIRGVGSIYYLAFAIANGFASESMASIWSAVAFTIVLSVVVHGTTSTGAMRRLDLRRRKRERRARLQVSELTDAGTRPST